MRFGALALFAVFLCCQDTTRAPIELSPGDSAVYAAELQRYVGLGCGSLDCHGDGGRALRIFAEYGLRERDDLRNQPPSQSEVASNVQAFAGLAGDSPASHLALLKALAVDAGGMAHEGGDVWRDSSAPGYRCLLAFLSNQTDPDACAVALAEVEVD